MLRSAVLREPERSVWLQFADPVECFATHQVDEVKQILAAAQARVQNEALYAVGYLSYEAAPAFDEALTTHSPGALPLICLSLFAAPTVLSQLDYAPSQHGRRLQWREQMSRADYLASVAAIKREIALGNTYQVNLTMQQQAHGLANPWQLFCDMAADAPFAAYLDLEDSAIISASPELFFDLRGSRIRCRPMKGTARREVHAKPDRKAAESLRQSVKDRAENVMIADMIRNDLGRIARPGTVIADQLFDIERYPTVWQMTSSISAETDASIPEIFAALFPCGSVTGAPKVSSMQIINSLESLPREVYTGAIGYFGPDREARFNVAIRTAWVNRQAQLASYGVGSGIVADSVPADELAESRAKARVLNRLDAHQPLEILETMRWSPDGGYANLELHLDRAQRAAEYFGYAFSNAKIKALLAQESQELGETACRVRLAIDARGDGRLEAHKLPELAKQPLQVALAALPISPENALLYYKTTRRGVYHEARRSVASADDVLLWNSDGFVTETSIANVAFKRGGQWLTPPVESGLLAGIQRTVLLQSGAVQIQAIHKDQLQTGEELMLFNSIRGTYTAVLL